MQKCKNKSTIFAKVYYLCESLLIMRLNMNKQILKISGILSLFILLFSCKDDEPQTFVPDSDNYIGNQRIISLSLGMDEYNNASFKLAISTPEGTTITRTGTHRRIDGESILTLDSGLKEGEYRLLYLLSPVVDSEKGDTVWDEYGLGCRIRVKNDGSRTEILDVYNSDFRLFGSGTAKDPFSISSGDDLKKIRNVANDQMKNKLLLANMQFVQTCDIYLEQASWKADKDYGWMPIGSLNTTPFRGIYNGNGYKIYDLWINRQNSGGLGLFGYADEATFRNINMVNPTIDGNFATGTILGAVVKKGNKRTQTNIVNCTTTGGRVSAKTGSVAIGGILGLVDLESKVEIDGCTNISTAVAGSYGVGGIVGAASLFSYTSIEGSKNSADIKSEYTGCGGIIGTCDTLSVMSCVNEGRIMGSTAYTSSDKENAGIGTGGIAGGSGMSYFYTSRNYGEVSGYTGVGGILGSTCVSADHGYFNNAGFRSCSNEGNVSGETSVGGICGEAQMGCFAVYNKGEVTARANSAIVGGIAGNTSVAVIHNTLNAGNVKADNGDCVGGLVGKSTWGTFFASQNLADVSTSANYAAGIVALAGNQTTLNYCCNAGKISNSANGVTGGIVGELGDPREWTTMNTINCIIGAVECVLGIAGPVIACTGEALEKGTNLAKVITNNLSRWKNVHKVAHIIEFGFDISTLAYDWTTKIIGWASSPEELEALRLEITKKAEEIDSETKSEMEHLRSTLMLPKGLYSSLNAGTATQYYNNLDSVLSYVEESSDNSENVNFNLNNERESRIEEVQEQKEVYEIVHQTIGTACLVVSTAAFVVGTAAGAATGGASVAIAAAVVGGITTFTGGVNAIVENCDDYQPNAATVTQCVNLGNVAADNCKNPGGIAGHFQQFCQITDCLNIGEYSGSKTEGAGIVGELDSESEILRCLNVGNKWGFPIYSDEGAACTLDNNYYFDATSPGIDNTFNQGKWLTLDELCKTSSYKDWDFTSDNAQWKIEEKSGYFPVPNHSKMEIDD